MNKILQRKHYIVIIAILVFIAMVSLVTYAYGVWGSNENTVFDTTIGDIAGVRFENGNSINVTGLGPVLDYNDGANVEFAIFNRTTDNISVSAILDIGSISENLKSSDFKWVLTKYNNSTEVYDVLETGDFSGYAVGSNTVLNEDSIPYGYSYYKFFVYIDGTVSNDTSMMNNSLSSSLVINANTSESSSME